MSAFAEAFRRQALSDLNAYNVLVRTTLPTSHSLHYLQMWLEKLCKAYLWLPSVKTSELRTRHQVVGLVLPQLVRERRRRLEAFHKQEIHMDSIRALCREIDLLHPQVKDGYRRPENVEYPWIDTLGHSLVPAEFKFSLARQLSQRPGITLLKAAVQLTRDPSLLLA